MVFLSANLLFLALKHHFLSAFFLECRLRSTFSTQSVLSTDTFELRVFFRPVSVCGLNCLMVF